MNSTSDTSSQSFVQKVAPQLPDTEVTDKDGNPQIWRLMHTWNNEYSLYCHPTLDELLLVADVNGAMKMYRKAYREISHIPNNWIEERGKAGQLIKAYRKDTQDNYYQIMRELIDLAKHDQQTVKPAS